MCSTNLVGLVLQLFSLIVAPQRSLGNGDWFWQAAVGLRGTSHSGCLGKWVPGKVGAWESGRLGKWAPGKVGAWEIVVPTPTGEVCLSPAWQMTVFSRCPSVRVDGVPCVH